MKETEKYDSKLYKPNKPYHKMSIEELIGHCKICKSLDKMPYNKIKKIENLSDDVLQKKIKRFLERNNGKHYKKKYTKKNNNKINTRKENNNKINTRKENKKENKKNKTKKQFEKKNKTKKN